MTAARCVCISASQFNHNISLIVFPFIQCICHIFYMAEKYCKRNAIRTIIMEILSTSTINQSDGCPIYWNYLRYSIAIHAIRAASQCNRHSIAHFLSTIVTDLFKCNFYKLVSRVKDIEHEGVKGIRLWWQLAIFPLMFCIHVVMHAWLQRNNSIDFARF